MKLNPVTYTIIGAFSLIGIGTVGAFVGTQLAALQRIATRPSVEEAQEKADQAHANGWDEGYSRGRDYGCRQGLWIASQHKKITEEQAKTLEEKCK